MKFFDSVFSDETSLFRIPAEPEPNDTVTFRVRAAAGCVHEAYLSFRSGYIGGFSMQPMHIASSDGMFDYFSTEVHVSEKRFSYVFHLITEHGRFVYSKAGLKEIAGDVSFDSDSAFMFMPGFHVPEWSKGAVQYQIFVDRFFNGDTNNDVFDGEYCYEKRHVRHLRWNEPVTEPDIGNFYGGDLRGIMDKLDYLQNLGIEVLYLNPIFVSPSSHKYDTQDYEHIDPHFGIIVKDEHQALKSRERSNRHAIGYITRTASAENLEASDRLFAELCMQLHHRGMKIILDGVFNHCGSFNKWMDHEGIYSSLNQQKQGAYRSINSPYRSFFRFTNNNDHNSYEGWWNFKTLPKLDYEGSPLLWETILSIAEKWAKPPFNIDGWRLDVAADLGHSEHVNHAFWREFRTRLKQVNPNLLIIAEHYGDASAWLQGDQWDSVMNYDAFMEPITYFLTGMEKHSDSYSEPLYRNGTEFFNSMRRNMARMQHPSLLCAMNELSNHDHSRFLTRTNRKVGRLASLGGHAADKDVQPTVMCLAVVIQMTWPGAPTVYYGDEAGLCGWTDPDCRRPYPWGHESTELVELHRDMIRMRQQHSVFKSGSILELCCGYGMISYARFNEQETAIIVIHNADHPETIDVPVETIGITDGTTLSCFYEAGEKGYTLPGTILHVENGIVRVYVSACSAMVLFRNHVSSGQIRN